MDEGEQSPEELATDQVLPDADSEATTEEVVEDQATDEVDETAEEPDDSEEVEHNGERYKIPKALKDAFLMQQDYTKKTQETAEIRKALETQQQEFQQRVQFQQANIQELANLTAIEQQLAQFQNVDWQALIDQDPVEAMKLDRQYRGLTDAYNQTHYRIQQAQQQTALQSQQEIAKQREQGREALARELKDWSPEVGKEVATYIKQYERLGINDAVMQDINNGLYGPTPIIWARKAQLYDQLMQKTAKKPESAPPPKPVTKVGAKASVTKDPSQMSDKEFAAWRQKQINSR